MQSSMASVISLVVAVLVALPGVVAHDKYPYAILYNGGSSCKDSAVAIRGYVIGDDNMLYGAGDVECSKEAVCFLKPESEYCQAMNFTRETVLNNLEILNGTVYQCDETNVVTPNQSVCYEHLATDCMESSVYSNCDYMLFTKDDLMKDPLGYLSNTGEMGDVFDDQSKYHLAVMSFFRTVCSLLSLVRSCHH